MHVLGWAGSRETDQKVHFCISLLISRAA